MNYNRNAPNDIPYQSSSHNAANNRTEDIDVRIYDRSHPQGLMLTIDKKKALQQGLFEMMYRDLMSEADISPKFNGSEMVDGVYRLKAVNKHSVECLMDIIERMPPPWPNAQLYVEVVDSKKPKRPIQNEIIVVEAFVPDKLVVVCELLDKINQFDRRIRTNQWNTLGNRPLGNGNVYTFRIAPSDFEVLNTYDGFVPYNGSRIEFRVLKNPDLIPKI